MDKIAISIIIPTYNGEKRIGKCLASLAAQIGDHDAEIIVVDDGSTDKTAEVAQSFERVRLITQENSGPAAARNRGAREAGGELVFFTDDDCEPAPNWLEEMRKPFADPAVVGVKGAYRTRQRPIIARFVQAEYEDRYRFMAQFRDIDFVDTYSAGFRRSNFLEMGGYDTEFPVACAEDIELSYRMSARNWKMRFAPDAIVYHQHPDSCSRYVKKKFKFAFWRVLAVRKNPRKAVKDSHTPQLMKAQLFLAPAVILGAAVDLAFRLPSTCSSIVLGGFLVTTLPFAIRTMWKDPVVGIISPAALAARSCSQFAGVVLGVVGARSARRL